MRRLSRLALALACLAAPVALPAQYAPNTAFASGTNPSGPWSFGWKSTPTSGFAAFGVYHYFPNFYGPGLDYARWSDGSTYGGAYYYNGTVGAGNGVVALHPGFSGEIATVRFTAPTTASYTFAGSFMYSFLTSSDAYVVLNDAMTLASGFINGGSPTLSFNLLLSLTAGDRVDFLVGTGGNGYTSDSTILDLSADEMASTVPEPASLALVGTGLAGVLVVGRRRRQRGGAR